MPSLAGRLILASGSGSPGLVIGIIIFGVIATALVVTLRLRK